MKRDYTKLICHRRPDRSFFFRGHQFPVCSRCTGIYLSIFVYVIYAYFIPIHYTIYHFIIATILIIPCGIDGVTQLIGLRESNNKLRFITGALGGIGGMVIVKYTKLLMLIYLH